MFAVKLICILFILEKVSSNEPPKVSVTPQKMIQKAGQQAFFSCVLNKGSQPVQFDWFKNDENLKPSQTIAIETSKKSSNLILESVVLANSANYSCRASNPFGSDHSTSILLVEGSPQWLVKPSSMRVGPEERFNIQCSGMGHPTPSVTWKKQINEEWLDLFEATSAFNKISPNEISGHKLIKEKDEGKYGCEISNGINPSLWSEFVIKISGKKSYFG
ncbi:protein sax-3-like [Brevipalpus obovatus]|uniref:protein sax-3-like n=1 Tax=Brevipalpus obovatus TaxID=246614 RepID=UPI003D9E0768